jgi:hypothetical protein
LGRFEFMGHFWFWLINNERRQFHTKCEPIEKVSSTSHFAYDRFQLLWTNDATHKIGNQNMQENQKLSTIARMFSHVLTLMNHDLLGRRMLATWSTREHSCNDDDGSYETHSCMMLLGCEVHGSENTARICCLRLLFTDKKRWIGSPTHACVFWLLLLLLL